MNPLTTVLVPYAPAGLERLRAWTWVAQRWALTMPEAEIVVAAPNHATGDPALFCRAEAINNAAAEATGDVFVIADADTAFDPVYVTAAINLVAAGEVPWVLPGRYVRLSRAVTADWIARNPAAPPPLLWEQEIDEEWPANVSGIVVLPREGFRAAGGFDERFKGWGWEDGSFAHALDTLWGHVERLQGHIAWHLWHPRPPEHSTHGPYAVRQQRLGQRYIAAAGDRALMSELIDER